MNEISKLSRVLTSTGRKRVKPSNFVFPEEKRYPIHDVSHARSALSRVSQHGTAEEKSRVRAAVSKKYPGIEINKTADCGVPHKNLKDMVTGGLADGMPDKSFPKKQIAMGIKAEKEHTKNPSLAKEIAKDHLAEDRKYYTKLNKMEKKAMGKMTEKLEDYMEKNADRIGASLGGAVNPYLSPFAAEDGKGFRSFTGSYLGRGAGKALSGAISKGKNKNLSRVASMAGGGAGAYFAHGKDSDPAEAEARRINNLEAKRRKIMLANRLREENERRRKARYQQRVLY